MPPCIVLTGSSFWSYYGWTVWRERLRGKTIFSLALLYTAPSSMQYQKWIHYMPQDVWLVNREKKKSHTHCHLPQKGRTCYCRHDTMWKVNHSLAITVLDANILLLRLWVSLIRSSAPRWDLLQHQDILVMFFKSDCIRLNVLQTQIIPHTDAAVHSDNDRNFQSFRNSFGACDVNCRVYKLSHFQSQGLERSEGGPDEVWSIWSENCFLP